MVIVNDLSQEYGRSPRKFKNTMTTPTYCLAGDMIFLKKN